MDHKQQEAITSKKLAEGMLKCDDYSTAKSFASMSQRLYPELEGISQMCAMLDVLISSERRINGVRDWYGVLGVDPTADAATISKQFRRLALLLHPDKNRSFRAEDAFKLVSEAKDLLLDEKRRSDYDRVIGLGAKSQAPEGGPSATHATSPIPRWTPAPANAGPSWNTAAHRAPTYSPWARARGPTENVSNPWGGPSARTSDSSWASTGGQSARTNDRSWAPTGGPSTRTNDWSWAAPTGAPSNPAGGPSARTFYSSWAPNGGPSANTGHSPWAYAGGPSWNAAAHTTNTINPWARTHRSTERTSNPWHPNGDPSRTGGSTWAPTGAPSAPTGGHSAGTGGSSAQTSGPSAPSTGGQHFTFTNSAQIPRATCPRPTPVHPRIPNMWTTCHRCRIHFELPGIFRDVVIICANCSRAFVAIEVSPEIITRLQKPRPWPKQQPRDYMRHTEATAWMRKNLFENAPDKWAPPFGTGARFGGGNPNTSAAAAAGAEADKSGPSHIEKDVAAGIADFFKRQRMNAEGEYQQRGRFV